VRDYRPMRMTCNSCIQTKEFGDREFGDREIPNPRDSLPSHIP